MVSNGQPHNPMLWAPRRFAPIMSSPYFGYLPPGAPATFHSAPGAMSCGKFPNPKSVLPYLGNNKEAQMFLSRGAQVIIRMRGLPYNASPKEVVSYFVDRYHSTGGHLIEFHLIESLDRNCSIKRLKIDHLIESLK